MAMTKKEYAQKSREELYKNVKDFVFGFFENDSHVPAWKKPYRRVLSYNWLTSPKNEVKPYTFFNQCLLNDSGCFATFNQIMNLNDKADVESFLKTRNKDFLNINPFGHKSQKVVFMIRMEIPDKDLYGTPEYDKVKEAIKNKEKDPETYKQFLDNGMIALAPPHVEFFNVFNINDINNLPKSVYDEQMKRFENFNKMYCEKDIDKTLEEKGDLFIKSYLDAHPDITLLHSGINSPNYAYVPSIDEETEHTYRALHLPYKEGCVNLSSYYSIAAHEISHSTMVNDKERAKESNSLCERVANKPVTFCPYFNSGNFPLTVYMQDKSVGFC